jgi:ankyrin repeat protein
VDCLNQGSMQEPVCEHKGDAMAQHYREQGRNEVLDLLLMTDCRSFLQHLAKTGRSDMLRSLLQRHKATPSPALGPNDLDAGFLAAVKEDQAPCLQVMMAELDPEACNRLTLHAKDDDEYKSSALILAAMHRHVECLRQLLHHSSEEQVAVVNGNGDTALICAAENGFSDCVELLLQHSPEKQVAVVNAHGATALTWAAYRGYADCVEMLLQHSPEKQVTYVDKNGHTALMCAANEGHAECVEMLLQHSPEEQVAVVNAHGATALICAAYQGHAESVELLLQYSPEKQVVVVNAYGDTALTVAARNGHIDCIQLLLSHDLSHQKLDQALLNVVGKLPQPPPSSSSVATATDQSNPHRRCVELLLSKGAKLSGVAGVQLRDHKAMEPILVELAQRALVPDHANQAMVDLALSVRSGRKRSREQET